jgi:hypothetical protein
MCEREVYTVFWWGDLRRRDSLGDPFVNGRIILKCTLKKYDWIARSGFISLKTEIGGGLL